MAFDLTDISLKNMRDNLERYSQNATERQLCKRKTVVSLAYKLRDKDPVLLYTEMNGPYRDDPNRCINEVGNCGCIHSEVKLITSMLRQGWDKDLSRKVLCITHSPCTPCANLIVASLLFWRVYWIEDTLHDMRGIEILNAAGISGGRLPDA